MSYLKALNLLYFVHKIFVNTCTVWVYLHLYLHFCFLSNSFNCMSTWSFFSSSLIVQWFSADYSNCNWTLYNWSTFNMFVFRSIINHEMKPSTNMHQTFFSQKFSPLVHTIVFDKGLLCPQQKTHVRLIVISVELFYIGVLWEERTRFTLIQTPRSLPLCWSPFFLVFLCHIPPLSYSCHHFRKVSLPVQRVCFLLSNVFPSVSHCSPL